MRIKFLSHITLLIHVYIYVSNKVVIYILLQTTTGSACELFWLAYKMLKTI